MIYKRFFVFLLCFILVFNVTACKSQTPIEPEVPVAEVEQDQEEVVLETPPETVNEGFKLDGEKEVHVWEFATVHTKVWDEKKPLINPMGDFDAYISYDYDPLGYFHMSYLDASFNLVEEDLRGEVYTLEIPLNPDFTEEENTQFQVDFRLYIEEMNGVDYGIYEGIHTFYLKDEEGDIWWGTTEMRSESILLIVMEEDILTVGEEWTIDLEQVDEALHFTIEQDETAFRSLNFDFNSDLFDCNYYFNMDEKDGDYEREYAKGYSFENEVGDYYSITDLPNDTGFLRGVFEVYPDETEGEVTVSLLDLFTQEGDLYNEDLGAIKVSSEYISQCEISKSTEYSYLTHPDYDEEKRFMDLTPDGDFMILVPAGYWDVKLFPSNSELITDYSVVGVFVRSGEVTLVDVPYSISATNSNQTEAIDARGIGMHSFKEENDTVTYRFTLLDQNTKSVEPSVENTLTYESGEPVVIKSIERVETPPEIYLLIDSSGSMKGEMTGVIQAARAFIEGMSDDTKVTVVDFDSTVKILNGNTKEQALSNLNQLSVGGDTALYQSVQMAVGKLENASRPVIVAFTDGENDLKNESLKLEDVLETIETVEIPIFTIGFGENHDNTALLEMSKAGYGKYFRADDQEALGEVFNAINERLSNTFELTYERPKEAGLGDTPVLTFLLDTSGSMDNTDEGFGQRMHNLKELLKEFVLDLPESYRVQVMGFSDEPYYVQSLTGDKRKMIMGITKLEPGGGTGIPEAVGGAALGLKNLASTKKVLVFVTDEAMDSEDEGFVEEVLKLKEENVETLWVGFGNVEAHDDFIKAAELSGGEYLLSSDPDAMKEKINDLLDRVYDRPETGLSEVSMVISKEDEKGHVESFGANELVLLPPLPISDEIKTVNAIREYPGGIVSQYDKETADLLSGSSIPKVETIVTGRMPVNKTRSSEAMAITVNDLFFLDAIKGLKAPNNYQFVALDLSLENILKEQKVLIYPDGSNHPSAFVSGPDPAEEVMMIPDYLIPDFKSHFFLNINGLGGVPGSEATYLTEKSILVPGKSDIQIKGGGQVLGAMVFAVPKESVESMTLSFYDVNYGHINVPIVGTITEEFVDISRLPKEQPQVLSDSFTLAIADVSDDDILDEYGEPSGDTVYRTVTGIFTSNVQALLTLDPVERIKLEVLTDHGSFYFDLNAVTSTIPFGHFTQKMMAPGGENRSKWVFEIPKEFTDYSSNLIVELSGEDVVLPLKRSEKGLLANAPIYENEIDIDEDGLDDFKISILDVAFIEESIGLLHWNTVALDIVVEDYLDGYATSGINEIFFTRAIDSYGEERVRSGSSIEDLMLGFGDDTVVYDGTTRRGVVSIDSAYPDQVLVSEFFEDLEIPISLGIMPEVLGTEKMYLDLDDRYASDLAEAVANTVRDYETMVSETIEPVIAFEVSEKADVPVKSIASYGKLKLEEVSTKAEAIALLKGIRYVPTQRTKEPFNYFYSSEAVLTQNYGSANDFAKVALELFSKLGYAPKLKNVTLTANGIEALETFAKTEVYIQQLPAIQYMENGQTQLLVLPFVETLSDLDGLCYYSQSQDNRPFDENISIGIDVICENLKPGRMDHMSDFTDAMAGETDAGPHLENVEVFYGDMSLVELSLAPIDLGFYDTGQSYEFYISKGKVLLEGAKRLNKSLYKPLAVEITFYTNGERIEKIVSLDEERTLDQYFFTAAINLPDLTSTAVKYLEEEAKAMRESVGTYSDYSAMKWYTRDILYGFIANQSNEDLRLSTLLDVIIGRTNRERIILLTMVAPTEDKPLETFIDLLQNANEVHGSDDVNGHSFNIMSGFFQTTLESHVLGETGIGALEIMALTPEDTGLVVLEPYLENADVDAMVEAGLTEDMMTYFGNSDKYSIIPEKPAMINGQTRWAWIEIDSKTYATIGVTDTLSHGAMVTGAITGTVKDIGQYFVGQFVGTTTAIWSVAAFSLMEDDYEVILKEAKKFALGMKDSFGIKAGKFSMGVGGKPQISQKAYFLKGSFNGKPGISQTIYGFGTGFTDGIEAYFEAAE